MNVTAVLVCQVLEKIRAYKVDSFPRTQCFRFQVLPKIEDPSLRTPIGFLRKAFYIETTKFG